MDIAFYRDDYAKEGLKHDPKRTRIPFEVEGRDLLLVDDVLYTGRTVRAAMNELFDYGRPRSISLVVLADRGGRQLPIAAQYCGAQVEVPAGMRLRLKRAAERQAFAGARRWRLIRNSTPTASCSTCSRSRGCRAKYSCRSWTPPSPSPASPSAK